MSEPTRDRELNLRLPHFVSLGYPGMAATIRAYTDTLERRVEALEKPLTA